MGRRKIVRTPEENQENQKHQRGKAALRLQKYRDKKSEEKNRTANVPPVNLQPTNVAGPSRLSIPFNNSIPIGIPVITSNNFKNS